MITRLYPVLEHPSGDALDPAIGSSLARVAEAHPALAPLLDFACVDPAQIAREVGMVYPYEEDGEDDLSEIDFGPAEWFEPAAGLAAVRQAIHAVRADPPSLARALYDPGLRPEAVLADLEAIAQTLLLAQQRETRFHLVMEE